MKVIMTGGGTGGHIYPAVAIADEIRRRCPQAEILFVGAEKGLEKKIVPKCGYNIALITVEGFNRKNLLKNVEVLRKLIKGNYKAKKILKIFKPDFVIGTGGYASAPIVKAAQKLNIPTYIHESNAYPGIANKMLEKNANKTFLGFEKATEHFKEYDKVVISGNPVRDEFKKTDKASARKQLGFKESEFAILAFGGSQGAGRINKAMISVIKEFNGCGDVKICLGTGEFYYDAIKKSFAEKDFELADNIIIHEYIKDMATYLAAADLVICRSGALTVAETTVSGTPAIFIPSPMVTGNHQYYNALAVAENGGAIIIEEKDLEDSKLINIITELKNNPQMLKDMAAKSRMCGSDKASEIICNEILGDYANGETS